MDKIQRIKELVKTLNEARDTYYNNSSSIMTDHEYDDLFDELQLLENETKMILSNSPTQTVGYEVKSKLDKVKHNHPMLSLDKTKSVEDIVKFLDGRDGIAMLKMDGLTCSNAYHSNILVSSESRGDGEIGEDVLSNAKTIKNLPLRISIDNDLIVDGEVIIDYDTFRQINEQLPKDEQYKNVRNLASGSIRQLDSKVASKRNMKFIAWKVVKGINTNSHCERLNQLEKLGFEVVPFISIYNVKSNRLMEEKIEEVIEQLKNMAKELHYPIDGIVFGYDDVEYGESLGATGHHLRSQIAYKFYDDLSETTLLDIEWSPSRTGLLNPVAIFSETEIDGTTVSRASLHNISIMEELQLGIGDTITVYKANQIIPQVKENLTKSNSITYPDRCPICNESTTIRQDNDTKVLCCTNSSCKGKLLGKLTHFVSKPAMNIDGLSESTLEFLINKGWVNDYLDLYKLEEHKTDWMRCIGFGKASVAKVLDAIEKSKNVKLENFLVSLSIPLIGKKASKTVSKHCKGDTINFYRLVNENFDFTNLEDFGDTMNSSITNWFKENYEVYRSLATIMKFVNEKESDDVSNRSLDGKSICITGKLVKYPNRDALVKDIEDNGGKVVSGVTSKTDFLLTNDTTSGSSKNNKAKELSISIITEDEFINMIMSK